jgi:hypothetical protein
VAAGSNAPQTIESFGALNVRLKDGAGNALNLSLAGAAWVMANSFGRLSKADSKSAITTA